MTKVIDLLKLPGLEIKDEQYDLVLTRKLCAKIIHEYLQRYMHEPDETSIERAYFIKDLFDCRICANHIAQVYLKGIMDAFILDKDLVLFMPEKEVGEEELKEIIRRTAEPEAREKR